MELAFVLRMLALPAASGRLHRCVAPYPYVTSALTPDACALQASATDEYLLGCVVPRKQRKGRSVLQTLCSDTLLFEDWDASKCLLNCAGKPRLRCKNRGVSYLGMDGSVDGAFHEVRCASAFKPEGSVAQQHLGMYVAGTPYRACAA